MHIRCPHCQHPIELVDDLPLKDIECPSCGSSFSLVSDDTSATFIGDSQTIGHFNLVEHIGVGRFGSVWKAQDTELDRTVAVKIPRSDQLSTEESEAFFREARAAAQLKHPHIVPVHEVGRENETIYIVSDFIQGANLKEWISAHALGFKEAAELCTKLALAIHHAHESGVVHRDLKPSNIMMDFDGEPHIMDFGLAKRESGEITMTMDGQILGTPAYMSPEQAGGESHRLDGRADVYSLGVILYELLTGELPFRGEKRMLIVQILNDDPPNPRKLNAKVPRDLETICLKCLEKEPQKRYQTAQELADDLKRYLNNEPIIARPISRFGKILRWTKRKPAVASLSAVVVLTLLVGITVSTYFAISTNVALAEVKEQKENVEEERDRTDLKRKEAEAVLRFFQEKVLVAARPEGQDGGLGVNATIRAALDAAEPDVAESFKDQPLVEAAIRSTLGNTYLYLGEAELAIRQHQRALELMESHLDPQHPDTLRSMGALAAAYRDAGRLEEALPLFEETLKLMKANLGPQHPDTLILMNNLAVAYKSAGRLKEALPLKEETLKLVKAKFGPQHPRTLIAMGNLALAYRDAGKQEEALPLFEETLKLKKAKLGSQHPGTLMSMNNLAAAYLDAGRLEEALLLFEETLKLMKAKLGPQHPDTLRSMGNLASVYLSAGRLGQALPLFEETLKLTKAHLGPQHPHTLISMGNLAGAYHAVGRLEDALPLFEETLKLTKAKLGLEHPSTLSSMNNLASAYKAAGKLDRALTLFEETLKLKKAKLGPQHPGTLMSMNNLAAAYLTAGRPEEALLLSEETLKLTKAQLGPHHPNTLMSMSNLANAYRSVGRLEEALPLFEETLKLMTAKLGPQHPNTLTSMSNLASAYRSVGRLEEALPLFEKTLKLRKIKLGPHHPSTLTSMNNLAVTYLLTEQPEKALTLFDHYINGRRARAKPDERYFAGRLAAVSSKLLKHRQYSAAESYLRECLTIREKVMPDHWLLFKTKTMLGAALAGQKKFDEAEPLLLEGYKGMKQREDKIPVTSKVRLSQALQRLVDLYTTWNKPAKAAEWQKKLDATKAKLKKQKKKSKPKKQTGINKKGDENRDKPLVAPRPKLRVSKSKE